jgi:hypothetical protein
LTEDSWSEHVFSKLNQLNADALPSLSSAVFSRCASSTQSRSGLTIVDAVTYESCCTLPLNGKTLIRTERTSEAFASLDVNAVGTWQLSSLVPYKKGFLWSRISSGWRVRRHTAIMRSIVVDVYVANQANYKTISEADASGTNVSSESNCHQDDMS